MKTKSNRLEVLRMIISSRELGNQEELLNALQEEGFKLTQATLSRDLKQLKVATTSLATWALLKPVQAMPVLLHGTLTQATYPRSWAP